MEDYQLTDQNPNLLNLFADASTESDVEVVVDGKRVDQLRVDVKDDDATDSEPRLSKDEIHLARYPISLLTYQARPGKIIEVKRQVKNPATNKYVTATWRVTGDSQFGLPTATDEAVLLVCLEFSRDQCFRQTIYFSRYDFIKRLGWPDNAESYKKLKMAFVRLGGVNIMCENVFWDKQVKSFRDMGGDGLLRYDFLASPPGVKKGGGLLEELPLSYFHWDDRFWRSFRDGNLKLLDLSFFLELKLPTTRRLFRFLDAVRHDGKRRYEIGLEKLCREYLDLSPERFPSRYKRALQPVHDELIAHDFLREAFYEPMKTDDGEKVVYLFSERFVVGKQLRPRLDMHVDELIKQVGETAQSTSESLNAYRAQYWLLEDTEWVEVKRRVLNLQAENRGDL